MPSIPDFTDAEIREMYRGNATIRQVAMALLALGATGPEAAEMILNVAPVELTGRERRAVLLRFGDDQ